MSFENLAFLALIAVAGAWRYHGLRLLALIIMLSVMVIPFTDTMPKLGRVYIFVPLDLIWAAASFYSYRHYKERLGLLFLIIGTVQMIAHFAFALLPTAIAGWNYIAFLNISFVGSCLILGVTGFARLHRHLAIRRGPGHRRVSARTGGQ